MGRATFDEASQRHSQELPKRAGGRDSEQQQQQQQQQRPVIFKR